jgi:hypothetical protein
MADTFEEALDKLIADFCKHPGASTDELISAMELKIMALREADEAAEGE